MDFLHKWKGEDVRVIRPTNCGLSDFLFWKISMNLDFVGLRHPDWWKCAKLTRTGVRLLNTLRAISYKLLLFFQSNKAPGQISHMVQHHDVILTSPQWSINDSKNKGNGRAERRVRKHNDCDIYNYILLRSTFSYSIHVHRSWHVQTRDRGKYILYSQCSHVPACLQRGTPDMR